MQLGDLVNQVSTNGSIVFPNTEILTFGTQGAVGEVLVEEGQQVEEGQILADLDRSTVASLETHWRLSPGRRTWPSASQTLTRRRKT